MPETHRAQFPRTPYNTAGSTYRLYCSHCATWTVLLAGKSKTNMESGAKIDDDDWSWMHDYEIIHVAEPGFVSECHRDGYLFGRADKTPYIVRDDGRIIEIEVKDLPPRDQWTIVRDVYEARV